MRAIERSVAGRVRGRVQGVSFRASLAEEARRLGLAGWVRNRRDGSVEFVAGGRSADVEALLAWARRGPPAARVDELEVAAADAPPAPGNAFTVREDA